MAQAAPGWGTTPQTPAAPPAGSGGKARGRGPVIAIVVGLVVFAGSAVGAFALSGGFGGRVGQSVPCGGNLRCIPSLSSGAVIDALTAEGYECLPPGAGTNRSCQTQIGSNLYEVQLSGGLESPDPISAVNASVSYPEESQPSVVTKSYLAWFASLPYGDDPVTVGEVTAWLNERIDSGEDEAVVIGGYGVGLQLSEPGRIVLTVRGA